MKKRISRSTKKKKTPTRPTKPKPKPKTELVDVVRPTEEVMQQDFSKEIFKKPKKMREVCPINVVGRVGLATPYAINIDTVERARDALRRAHFSPHPAAILRAVYSRYPELQPNRKK